jgi:hypothetical protein
MKEDLILAIMELTIKKLVNINIARDKNSEY